MCVARPFLSGTPKGSDAYITSTVAGDQLKPGNIAYIIVNNQSTNSAEVLTATLIAWVYRKHM